MNIIALLFNTHTSKVVVVVVVVVFAIAVAGLNILALKHGKYCSLLS